MYIYHTVMPYERVCKKDMRINTIICVLDNGCVLTCNYNDFVSPKKKLELFCYIKKENKWKKIFANDAYTREMWKYYRQLHKHFKSRRDINYEQMMKHDRKHKHGSGGSRIFNGSITDYECTKYPMHDFPRSRYVQWN